MNPLPDLVKDSRLETEFHDGYTAHIFHEVSSWRRTPRKEYWTREKRIARGAYGVVWRERCSKEHGVVEVRAVKQIPKPAKSKDYLRELETIAKFSHPRYVRCFVKSLGWYEDEHDLYIAMEYLPDGDLYSHLEKGCPLPEFQAQQIALQLSEALFLMHDNGFAHRDLKPQNILISSKPPVGWWVKVADFGVSKRAGDGPATTGRGTPGYMAPECCGLIDGLEIEPTASDIWALGEIVHYMLTLRPAFHGRLRERESFKYVEGRSAFPDDCLRDIGVSDAAIQFVKVAMKPEPTHRMTSQEALEHVWMNPEYGKSTTDGAKGIVTRLRAQDQDPTKSMDTTGVHKTLTIIATGAPVLIASTPWNTLGDPATNESIHQHPVPLNTKPLTNLASAPQAMEDLKYTRISQREAMLRLRKENAVETALENESNDLSTAEDSSSNNFRERGEEDSNEIEDVSLLTAEDDHNHSECESNDEDYDSGLEYDSQRRQEFDDWLWLRNSDLAYGLHDTRRAYPPGPYNRSPDENYNPVISQMFKEHQRALQESRKAGNFIESKVHSSPPIKPRPSTTSEVNIRRTLAQALITETTASTTAHVEGSDLKSNPYREPRSGRSGTNPYRASSTKSDTYHNTRGNPWGAYITEKYQEPPAPVFGLEAIPGPPSGSTEDDLHAKRQREEPDTIQVDKENLCSIWNWKLKDGECAQCGLFCDESGELT